MDGTLVRDRGVLGRGDGSRWPGGWAGGCPPRPAPATVGTSMRTSMRDPLRRPRRSCAREERAGRPTPAGSRTTTAALMTGRGMPWRPGARGAAASVRDAGLATALVTTTPRRIADIVLDRDPRRAGRGSRSTSPSAGTRSGPQAGSGALPAGDGDARASTRGVRRRRGLGWSGSPPGWPPAPRCWASLPYSPLDTEAGLVRRRP